MKTRSITFVLLIAAWASSPPWASGVGDPDFGAYWHDGKAELDGYRLTVQRYGRPRPGRGVLIYVTEPFSLSKHVKVNDPSRHPSDTFDALKLNLIRDFQTGVYDYHTIVSLFVRSHDFSPIKAAFSSSEWCGQVYEELHFNGPALSETLSSYFEDESAARSLDVPAGGIAEDDLFILLRDLRGPYLRPGDRRTVPFLPSSFYRRLTHQAITWASATLERLSHAEQVKVPAGTFVSDIYVIHLADGREGRFYVERDYPHRVVRWTWMPRASTGPRGGLEGTDAGELTGSARLEYWKLHDRGDESYLERVGLGPAVK